MDAIAFVSMWLMMVAGMMLPTVAPMAGATWSYLARRTLSERLARVAAFIAVYLVLWALAGGVALGLWTLAGVVPVVGAVLVAIAGAYQLSPLKERCLRICRTPVGFLLQHGGRMTSVRGTIAVGGMHAGVCIGCCAGLMVSLTGAGILDITWMGALALLMLLEKVHPFGRALGRGVGVLLIAASPFAAPLASGAGLAHEAGAAALIVLAIVALVTLFARRPRTWSPA